MPRQHDKVERKYFTDGLFLKCPLYDSSTFWAMKRGCAGFTTWSVVFALPRYHKFTYKECHIIDCGIWIVK